jgi:outer membrane protein OmpA-like peptidoglycan-associated protein
MLRIAAGLGAAMVVLLATNPARAQPPVEVVFFSTWSGDLDESAQAVIARAAQTAKAHPAVHLTVTGYADSQGSNAADKLLSQLRAQRVIDTLMADGVPGDQLDLVAHGATPATDVSGRRVEITFAGG